MSTEDRDEASPHIPVLLDVIEATPATAQPAALQRLQQLSADQRAAVAAEARYLLDELLDECLPILEAQLRERLERRLHSLLDEQNSASPT